VGDTAVNEAVPIALDDAGNIYLFATRQEGSARYPHVLAVNRQGGAAWERTLEAPLVKFSQPRIYRDGEELVLLWLDDQSVYAARVDRLGNVHTVSSLLSGEINVDSYDVATSPNGSAFVWFSGPQREPGIYALRLDDPGGESVMVDAVGVHPAVRCDGEGTLHAAWLTYLPGQTEPALSYVAFPGGAVDGQQSPHVIELSVRSDSALRGPWLGLDGDHVYLFWLEVIRSGRRMNQGDARYIHFPTGEPKLASAPEAIVVPYSGDLDYAAPPQEGLPAGQRVPAASGSHTYVSPSEIVVNAGAERELALALATQLAHRRNNVVTQVSTLFLRDGGHAGYQLLTFNSRSSLSPAIASDEAGQLYVTWIERREGSGYDIYLASTAPDIRQALEAPTRGDVSRMAAATVFGLLQGAVFFPFAALIWLALPAVLLAITWPFRRGSNSLVSRPALVSIVLAVAAYWAGKLVTFARAGAYVPFLTWIPVLPAWLHVPLQWGVPVAGTLIALWVAWYYARRGTIRSAAWFVAIYGAVDSLLTMAVYGGFLYNTF